MQCVFLVAQFGSFYCDPNIKKLSEKYKGTLCNSFATLR